MYEGRYAILTEEGACTMGIVHSTGRVYARSAAEAVLELLKQENEELAADPEAAAKILAELQSSEEHLGDAIYILHDNEVTYFVTFCGLHSPW